MQRLRIPNDLIDRCQSHVFLGGAAVRRHYLLYDYADEKRGAWEKLGAHVEGLLNSEFTAKRKAVKVAEHHRG